MVKTRISGTQKKRISKGEVRTEDNLTEVIKKGNVQTFNV